MTDNGDGRFAVEMTEAERVRFDGALADVLCWTSGFIARRPGKRKNLPEGLDDLRELRNHVAEARDAALLRRTAPPASAPGPGSFAVGRRQAGETPGGVNFRDEPEGSDTARLHHLMQALAEVARAGGGPLACSGADAFGVLQVLRRAIDGGDAPAGWTPPGWAVGARGLFETAAECAEHMRIVGNEDPRGPLPMYAEPRGPAAPAEGIVGWMLVARSGDERRLFCKREKAVRWHGDAPGQ